MKLCPCGHYGDGTRICNCSEMEIQRYRSRLSGPMMDRIDLYLTLSPVPLRQLGAQDSCESSETIRARVEAARQQQRGRYARDGRPPANAHASGRVLIHGLATDARELLNTAAEALALSARSYHRVVKVARTIADLANHESIAAEHVSEALRFRPRLN